MSRTLLLGLVLLLAVLGLGWWYVVTHHQHGLSWQGYAEADFVMVAPTGTGLLTTLHVARGDHVEAGAPLFDQDETLQQEACDQAQRQLDQASLQLANLEAPVRPTEIKQAEANLQDAIATRDRLARDAARYDNLLPGGSVSIQVRDQARADAVSAAARVDAMQAALAQTKTASGRSEEIKAQAAAVAAARAGLAMATWQRSQRHVAAPVAGVVADTLARSGETVAAGAPVVLLLAPGNIVIRFFVPEPMLARIHRGDRVALVCDNGQGGLTGTVDYIAPQAEYTPPVIYSEESKSKLVYMCEARPRPEEATLFNPGQPVVVHPFGQDAGP